MYGHQVVPSIIQIRNWPLTTANVAVIVSKNERPVIVKEHHSIRPLEMGMAVL
jgi:hypothetical protein